MSRTGMKRARPADEVSLQCSDGIVRCSVATARRAATLDYWLEHRSEDDDTPFIVPFGVRLVEAIVVDLESLCDGRDQARMRAYYDSHTISSLRDLAGLAAFLEARLISTLILLRFADVIRGLRPEQFRCIFEVARDMSEEEEAASVTEPDLTPVGAAHPFAPAGSVSDGRGPETLVPERQMSLSEVLEKDQFKRMLRMLTLPELRVLKGVSRKWRDRVRALISDPYSEWRRAFACRASEFSRAVDIAIDQGVDPPMGPGGEPWGPGKGPDNPLKRLIKEYKGIARNENLVSPPWPRPLIGGHTA